MKNYDEFEGQSFVTYYRVQGGKPPLASLKSVYIDESGTIQYDKRFNSSKKPPINVFFGDTEFMQSFLNKRAMGFLLSGMTEKWDLEVVKNIIPRFLDDFISKNTHAEMRGLSLRNPVRVSHGPGIGYQFNNAWRDLFFACSLGTELIEIPSKSVMRKFLMSNALDKNSQTTKKIDGERVLTLLREIISYKTDKTIKLRKNEEPNLIGLNPMLDQMEKNYALFETPKAKLVKEINNVRRDFNSLCEKTKK